MFRPKKEERLRDWEKNIIDKDLDVYRKSKLLSVDREVFDKQATNWEKVQDARRNSYEQQLALRTEAIKLEAKLEAMKESIRDLNNQKDQELSSYKELLKEAIKALQIQRTEHR